MRSPVPGTATDRSPSCRARLKLRLAAGAVVCVSALLLSFSACHEEPPTWVEPGDPNANREAWRKTFDEVPADDPLRQRAEQVFEQVRDASGDYAELVMLEMNGSPLAFALPDESIILSRAGLELCYSDVPTGIGDSRLAFLLGHELAHIAADDFWHAPAFAAVKDVEDPSEEMARLQALLKLDSRDRQKQELNADDFGILTAIQAGFDPEPILSRGKTFFEHWVGGAMGSMAYGGPNHPSVGQRAEFLRERLADVAASIDLFHQGVTAFQEAERLASAPSAQADREKIREKYEEAVSKFDQFRRSFRRVPGRETLSNLALAHLRLAAEALAQCDGTLVSRYYLPTVLDPVTLAERTVNRGTSEYSSPCFDNEDYQKHMSLAKHFLEEAVDRDPGYLLARLNSVAAWVLDEEEARAALLALETRDQFSDDSRAATAWAAASFAYLETGSTLYSEDTVVPQFKALLQRFPEEPGLPFNFASYLVHQGRLDEARPVWRDFLELEPEGPWAEIAREWVGDEPVDQIAP